MQPFPLSLGKSFVSVAIGLITANYTIKRFFVHKRKRMLRGRVIGLMFLGNTGARNVSNG